MLKCEKEDRKEEAQTITQWESWSGEEKNRNNHWRNRLQTLPKSNLTIAALVSQSPEWPHKSHPRLCFHDRAKLLWLNTQEYGMIKVSVVLRGDWDMIYYIVLTGRLLLTKRESMNALMPVYWLLPGRPYWHSWDLVYRYNWDQVSRYSWDLVYRLWSPRPTWLYYYIFIAVLYLCHLLFNLDFNLV